MVKANVLPDLKRLLVPVEKLQRLPGNPRRGDVEAVIRSYTRFGQRKPIVATGNAKDGGVVSAGNHQLDAVREMGWTHIAVAWTTDTEEEAKAFALADNHTAELGTNDDADLLAMLQSVHDADADLFAATSYDDAELKKMVSFMASTKRRGDVDEVPERAPSKTKVGDVWLLGDHRLMCGDSFDAENVAKLMNGEEHVDLVLTDPPYAIYGSSSGVSSDVADDKMVRPFFEGLGRMIHSVLKEFGHAYVHCDWRSFATVWHGMKTGELAPKNCIVWDKGGSGLGANYANTYEFVAFFAKVPPLTTMTSSAKRGQRQVYASNIYRTNRVTGDERQHNAAKPVDLLEWLIGNSSDEGETVIDLFGGSGSTLIACQQTGRVARVMELEPKYCDIICKRWEDLTDEAPVLERTGKHVSFR